MRQNRNAAALILGCVAVIVALLVLLPFFATRAHADESAPQTVTVTWVVTSGDFGDRFATPQRIATDKDTCGLLEQVDVYRFDTHDAQGFVQALVAKGILNGPSEDGAVWLSNTDVTLPACVTPTTPTSTTTPTPVATTTAPPVTATPSPTSSPTTPVAPSPSASSTPPTLAPSSPSSAPPTASATPTATTHLKTGTGHGELAFTGSTGTWVGAIVAGVLVLLGLALLLLKRRDDKKVNLDE